MVPFNRPPYIGRELDYVREAVEENRRISGDGPFTKRCSEWMERRFGARKVLLTTSGTAALEMAALLSGVGAGDEVILPSYTFSSTATAFANLGATLVFVDVRPDTMNIDERAVEAAITPRTKAIVAVHYAGVACDMDAIMRIARDHGLLVVEDAAQGVMASYRGRALGTIGDFGCYSFHETKNYSMGEGGAIVVNDESFIERAEIIREKGTNRSRFHRGQVDKYTWVDQGSSYLPSELNAAYLWAQLEAADDINDDRLATWNAYREAFEPLRAAGLVELPHVPAECTHNAHLFYLKLADVQQRGAFIDFLKQRGISSVFHYVPLHSSPAGQRFGRFCGTDRFTTRESDRLTRLPLFFGMTDKERAQVVETARAFFQ
ncbi:MAG TPA: dTDP-4-amino-4,6-dideoxygalactose transaminase [Eggerthellaceae bacterium]|nr:dTDP-4-amino-4,6-dideoxygalactose transaminase [Eggerthellaceae bacterium]